MSETTETLKKALMFQLKNPDGSVNWMMSVFVWVFLLLILFIVVYFPMKAMKSKFGNTAADEPLTIYLRSGMKDWSEAYNRSLSYIYNDLAPIGALSLKNDYTGRGVEHEMVQETTASDEVVTRQRVDYDATLGNTVQILYSSGSKSLFGDMPKGTVLVELTPRSPTSTLYDATNTSTLQRYTDPRIVWLRLRFNIGLDATARNAIISALEAIVDPTTNVAFQVTSWTSDSRITTAGRMEIDVVGGGRLRPEAPGLPWFDQLGEKTSKPVTILVLDNITTTWSGFTQQQQSTLTQAAAAARTTRPAPTFQSTYLIEAPASKMDIANAVANYLKNVKHFAPYENTTVKIETSTTNAMNISLTSMTSSLGIEWKRVTMPVLLTVVPGEVLVSTDQICGAVTSSVKFYNDMVNIPEPQLPKNGGPFVIRVEGDMPLSFMRSRLEHLNFLGSLDQNLTFVWKYVQNKNKNRPRGTVFAYLESYDKDFVSKRFPPQIQTMVARVPIGSFLGMTKAHFLVNGPDMTGGRQSNPLLANGQDVSSAINPLTTFVQTGKGALPREEDIIDALGCPIPDPCPPEKVCPTPEPCPSCPPEKICPTPDPCPSCPTFDVATMCPKQECPTFDVATMCPSKPPAWPLKKPIPATAKSFNLFYVASKTQAIFVASIIEALQMRIAFTDKPIPNLKAVTKTTGYNTNVIGVEYYDAATNRVGVKSVTVAANNVRKGVEDIYAILGPYL